MKGESSLADNPKDIDVLRARKFRARAQATAWLASKQAAPYYDIIGLDQEICLDGCNWEEYAVAYLRAKPEEPLSPEIRHLLREALWALR